MDYKRTMCILSLLHTIAEGDNKIKLQDLFKQAVLSTNEYQKLKSLLESVSVLNIDGEAKYKECEAVLSKALSEIDNSSANIKNIVNTIEQIDNELSKNESLLSSPAFFDNDFPFVSSKTATLYSEFYRYLANCICYYLASQFGIKSLENLTFNYSAGFRSLSRLVNQKFGDELISSSQNAKRLPWIISRISYYGDNIISYDGYKLEYTNLSLETFIKNNSPNEFGRVSPYMYYSKQENSSVVFAGVGNIIGVDLNEALSLLGSQVVTDIPSNTLRLGFEKNNILKCISDSINTNCYCISPDNLVSAMNSYEISKIVSQRRSESKCIICNKPVFGRISCKEHFSISSQQV